LTSRRTHPRTYRMERTIRSSFKIEKGDSRKRRIPAITQNIALRDLKRKGWNEDFGEIKAGDDQEAVLKGKLAPSREEEKTGKRRFKNWIWEAR